MDVRSERERWEGENRERREGRLKNA